MTPADPHYVEALSREALAKAETAELRAGILAERLEERSTALADRFDDLRSTVTAFRTEAREDHATASRALAHMRKDLEKVISENAQAAAGRLEEFGTQLGELAEALKPLELEDAEAERALERRKLSNGRLAILAALATALSGSLGAIVIQLLSHP